MQGTLQAIGQIAIPTTNLERAVAFYRDALGLDFLFETGPLAFLMCGDVRLMLTEPDGDEEHGTSVLYFRVADINGARSVLVGRGVEFDDEPHPIARMPDHELWMTFFRDPDGNLHGLMSEVR